MSSNWAELHELVAVRIIRCLPLADHIRFGSVCKRWHHIRRANRTIARPARRPVPCLLCPSTFTAYSLDETRLFSLPLPPKYNEKTLTVRSSQNGWLLCTEKTRNGGSYDTFLFNPISRAKLVLPTLSANGQYRQHYSVAFTVVPEFAVAVPKDRGMALCKPGDACWTDRTPPGDDSDGADVVAKDGKFYGLVQAYMSRQHAYGYDVAVVADVAAAGGVVERVVMDCSSLPYLDAMCAKLVVLEGRLLLVLVLNLNRCPLPEEEYEPEMVVEVFAAKLEGAMWEKVGSLGGGAVFVSDGGAVGVEAARVSDQGMADRVYVARPSYYTKLSWHWMEYDVKEQMAKYYLKKKKDTSVGKSSGADDHLFWFTPSLY